MRSFFTLLLSIFLLNPVDAQHLKPGFDVGEYKELLKVSARFGDSSYFGKIAAPEHFNFVYRSGIVGLENCWDLWLSKDSVAVINIRGTTTDPVSWLANFYAAMVPAKGSLLLSKNDTFTYELATNPKAYVHVGWLLSTAFLSKDILPKMDSCYRKGIKDVIIMGHSQGGAIAFLFTAYVYRLQKNGLLPADIRFKTYCSAGPKPGNLFFAYDYEAMTQKGWAFNVVNAADWVPETPISIQTLHDFNETNPFINAKNVISKQKFPNRMIMRHVFNKLEKPTRKAQRNYQKFLGKHTSRFVKKHISEYVSPEYSPSNNYVRTGTTIVLMPDEEYYKLYPDSKENVFIHHFHPPYLYLAERY